MKLTNITCINDLILKYYYELFHYEKYNESLIHILSLFITRQIASDQMTSDKIYIEYYDRYGYVQHQFII